MPTSLHPRGARKILDWTRNPAPPDLTPFQQFTRDVDWKNSPLGPMDSWPAQLRQLVLILMADPTASVVYWGEEQTIVYNEAYCPLIGQKHPSLQGQDPKIGFAEIWPKFDKIIREQQETGQTIVGGKQFLLLQRYGFLEETYFSWKFMPVIGEEGYVVASYATVFEVTREVVSDRRMSTIRTLGQHMSTAKNIKQLWTRLLSGLEHNDKDVPLALLYSVQETGSMSSSPMKSPFLLGGTNTICTLEGTLGITPGHEAAPVHLYLGPESEGLAQAFRDSLRTESPLVLQDGTAHSLPKNFFQGVEWRGFGVPCTSALVCPIRSGSPDSLTGFLLLALNPRAPYDNDYQEFISSVTKQITSPHFSAVLLQEEIRQGKFEAKQAAIERAELSKQLLAKTLEYEQSEAKFSRFADRVSVGFAIGDPNGRVLYANDSWHDILADSPDLNDQKPMSWVDCVVPEDIDLILKAWYTLSVEKKPIRLQTRFKKPWKTITNTNGETHIFNSAGLCAAFPDLNEDGSVKSIMSCVMDISELKWAEEQVRLRTQELEQSELRYRKFADYAPVGVCLLDHTGCMQFGNDAWYAITGQSKEDKACNAWQKPFHPKDLDKIKSVFADLLAGRGPITVESRLQRLWKPGDTESPAWVLASAYPELNASGTVKSIVCWLTDISAQKAAERDMRIRMDEALETKRQQDNFIDMTSHEIRNPLSAVLHCAEEIITSLDGYLAPKSTTKSTSPRNSHTTHRLPLELEELLASTTEAAQTISYCVQHQKRIVDDILTLSKLDSDLLAISPTAVQPANVVQDALKIFEGELRAADITLDFKKDKSLDDMGINWVLLDPSRVLQVLINLTTNAIKFTRGEPKRRITITLESSTTKPSEIDNGVVYFPQRLGKCESPRKADEHENDEELYLSIAVVDSGRGLSHEERKLLFNRFSQGSPKTHVKYGGSGLGLFISRQLTEMQGGEIGVTSEKGKGSKFVFYVKTKRTSPLHNPLPDIVLPIRALSSRTNHTNNIMVNGTQQTSSPARQASNAPFALKVLVVEDNLVNQTVLSKQLRKRGCTVDVANHGEEALEQIKKTSSWNDNFDSERPFDVILMDLEMPIMDGTKCVGKIRDLEAAGSLQGHVPVIAVTASVRGEHVNAAMKAGMDDVTTKPYRIEDILQQIHRAYHGAEQKSSDV